MMARLGTWKAYPKLPDKKGPKLSRQERALKKKFIRDSRSRRAEQQSTRTPD